MDEIEPRAADSESPAVVACDHPAPDGTGTKPACTKPPTRLVTLNVGAEFGGTLPVREVFRYCDEHGRIHESDLRLVEAIDWTADRDPLTMTVTPEQELDATQE